MNKYVSALEDFFQRFPDKKYPEDIHRYDIDDWRTAMLASGQGPVSVDHDTQAMRAFFNWMRGRGHVNYNPASIPRHYTPIPLEKRPLIDAEMLREVGKAGFKPRDMLLILLPLTTGLRTEELSKVWGIHFDQKEDVIRIGKQPNIRLLPCRDDVMAQVKLLSPSAMWGGKPLFYHQDNIPPRLRTLAKIAGVKDLTVSRLANTHDLLIQRALVTPTTLLDIHRQALEGIPRIS